MTKQYYVYIMSNRSHTLYTGITNDLPRRVQQHKGKTAGSFTKRYDIDQLVYAEATDDVRAGIQREKQIKGWNRSKKIALIEALNPQWKDLSVEWFGAAQDDRSTFGRLARGRGDSSLRSE